MNKLSKNYRNDAIEPLPADLRSKIDDMYLHSLENVSAINPRVLVVYSGGNAVGKSALSAKIATDLRGLVIENDAIKRAILKIIPTIDSQQGLNKLTWQYSMELYSRLSSLTGNGLIVRDGVIDWYYDRILPVFTRAGYEVFVVQFNQSKEDAIAAINNRGNLPTAKVETLLDQLDDHAIHQKRFRSDNVANIILENDSLYDHASVVEELKRFIAKVQQT